MDDNKVAMEITIRQGQFTGNTVHAFQLLVTTDDARLDCIYIDKAMAALETDDIPCELVARLNMSHRALRDLRDMLNNSEIPE